MLRSLSPHEVNELLQIIDTHFNHFGAMNINPDFLTPREKILLEDAGVDLKAYTPTVENAFRYGMLSVALGTERAKNLNEYELKRYIKAKKFLPMDAREKEVLRSLEHQAYHEIKGLGLRIKQDVNRAVIEQTTIRREEYEGVIKNSAKETVLNRESVKQMTQRIGEQTGDWARDLDRISDYILHEAHDTGRAMEVKKMYGQKAQVYKHVFNQACKKCVELYLTNGQGSAPRIYTVGELMRNGSNIGRKQKDWKPVIGATHPWCRCELEYIPEGYEWNEKKNSYEIKATKEIEDVMKLIKFKKPKV
jgi:hypothetical protein